MRFVLDASVTATWAMADESHPVADRAWEEMDAGTAVVPGIWWYEVRNILVVNERRQRISSADSAQFLRKLEEFDIEIDNQLDGTAVMELARKFGRSVYDAAYLELAMREGLPLATLDQPLIGAATALRVPLLV